MNKKIEEYYGKEKEDFISNSMLSWLSKSPSYFQYKLKTKAEQRETKSIENGKLLHLFIESPQDFIVSEVVKPSGMMGDFINLVYENDVRNPEHKDKNRAEAYVKSGFKQDIKVVLKNFENEGNQAYYSFLKESSDKIALTKDQKETIDWCISSLQLNPLINSLLFNYESRECEILSEEPLYFEYPIKTDWLGLENTEEEPVVRTLNKTVKCKGRPDKVIIDHERKLIIINDLKSTGENPYGEIFKVNSTKNFQVDFRGTGWLNNYVKYRCDKQAYFYIAGFIRNFILPKYSDYKVVFNFIVVETKQPYDTAVYQVNMENLVYAKRDIEIGLQSYLWYLETGDWKTPLSHREIQLI